MKQWWKGGSSLVTPCEVIEGDYSTVLVPTLGLSSDRDMIFGFCFEVGFS